MTDSTLLHASVSHLRQLLKDRAVSSEELTEACLKQINATNEALNAVITVCPEQALESARAADSQLAKGESKSLTGIPLLHKDIFCTRGGAHDLRLTHAGAIRSRLRCHGGIENEGGRRGHAR